MTLARKVTACRINGDDLGEPVFSLGQHPLPNAFVSPENLDLDDARYPLDVHLCESSGLAQLGQVIPPEAMFSQYAFFTSSSEPSVGYFTGLADLLARKVNQHGSLAVEIGCNDGTLTGQLHEQKFQAIGVDGAENCVEFAKIRYPGPKFYKNFFDADIAKEIRKTHGQAELIVGCNVVAHIDDVNGLFAAVDGLLSKTGVFVIEVPELQTLVDGLAYDTIYHEHLSYFSVSAFETLANRHGMYVDEAHHTERHAGSVRVFIRRKDIKESRARAQVLRDIENERVSGCATKSAWKKFSERAVTQRELLVQYLKELKNSGHKVCGYGAAAKATVMLNYCNITTDLMDFCTDTTEAKIGKYIPGVRIPVLSPNALYESKKTYAIMHCWNYKDAVLKNEAKWLDRGGKFILPLPTPKIAMGPSRPTRHHDRNRDPFSRSEVDV